MYNIHDEMKRNVRFPMKTKAVRLYGVEDLRLEDFELPEIKEDEILARVVSDSICMSSYKAAKQGSKHKRVPDNVRTNPVMIGHEFSLEAIEVGQKWQDDFQPGKRYVVQPALNYKGSLDAPGYSFPYIGGDATYVIIPGVVMESKCLLPYEGEGFFQGSLAEPFSCVAGAFHESFHTKKDTHEHVMGIREQGAMAILAGCGPMGLAAIEYAINQPKRPSLLVVTDIDQGRIDWAKRLISPDMARARGVSLIYLNTRTSKDPVLELKGLNEGKGFDDVFVFAPVKMLVEQADKLLGRDGCLNFFAGPTDPNFKVEFNFYDVHYDGHRITGTSGGNTDDMREVLSMFSEEKLRPEIMVSHVGGLNSVIDTTLNLPSIPGAKKLIYTHIDMPLCAIEDFEELGKTDPLYRKLDEICQRHDGLWSIEAETYLLKHGKRI